MGPVCDQESHLPDRARNPSVYLPPSPEIFDRQTAGEGRRQCAEAFRVRPTKGDRRRGFSGGASELIMPGSRVLCSRRKPRSHHRLRGSFHAPSGRLAPRWRLNLGQSQLSRDSGVRFSTVNQICTNATEQVSLKTLHPLSVTRCSRTGTSAISSRANEGQHRCMSCRVEVRR